MNWFAVAATNLLFALAAASPHVGATVGAPPHDCFPPPDDDYGGATALIYTYTTAYVAPKYPNGYSSQRCGDANRGMMLFEKGYGTGGWGCAACHATPPSTSPLTDPNTVGSPPVPILLIGAPRDARYIANKVPYAPGAQVWSAMAACGDQCLGDREPGNVMGDLGDIAEYLYTCNLGLPPCVTGGGGGGGGSSVGMLQGSGPIDFGNVVVGAMTGPSTLGMTNVGGMRVTVASVTSSNPAEFPVTSNGCGPVDPAAFCEIGIGFRPAGGGPRSGTVTVASDGMGSPQAFGLTGTGVAPGGNYTGLWWRAPANSESGWGVNLAHQGDLVFATWYTYDASGKPWWLSMLANRIAPGAASYAGVIHSERGPPFNAFVGGGTPAQVGSGTLAFTDNANGSFSYTVNGMAQTKAITRYDLSTGPMPTCTYGAAPNLAGTANYQDLWWAASGTEPGWGVNFAHQGDTIFATWYTYGADNAPLWLSALAPRVGATNVYAGTLYRTAGPRFDAYAAGKLLAEQVGTATFTFADGNHATFAYTTNGNGGLPAVTQSKSITRYLFAAPAGTMCN